MKRQKRAAAWLISFVAAFCLSACQGKTNGIDVLIFSDMSKGMKDQLVEKAFQTEHETYSVHIFPAIPEKLLVEITAKEGDIMLVPEEMFRTYDDPESFQLLEEMGVDDQAAGPYTVEDKKTGKTVDYAVQVNKGTKKLNGYTFRLHRDMVAFIPVYADKSKEALSLMKQLRENR
ncbi:MULTISPECIES: lipoprotein YteS [unclassified Bacillus (in: firmicutes)]|uniref:lipoprotein YteS n=1 Tax=unclassified Bacillus (in: firmicutes) TaxID=185979 RepID=UPI000D02E12C|nr:MULTISPECIES: lipoprotein YteS [unclassified Bacillus (in: firmicutes)]PRR93589.1 lipoprotein YteS [Bacillus sp. NMCN1]PRS01142.1 lipoprotein YteS [Bacillus sp. NMCN6]